MKIDKASFLLLAGALSAGACIIESNGSDDDGSGATGSGATGATGATGGTGGSGGDAVGGAGGSEGGAGGGTGGQGGGTCDDSMGTPADCTSNPTSCLEGLSPFCQTAADYFKPAVAQQATECIIALGVGTSDAEDCQLELECRDAAVAAACPEDVSVECAALVGDCTTSYPIDQAQCEAILPAFTAAGKQAVVDQCGPSLDGCLLGGVYTDLLNCVDNMSPAL